MAIILYGVLTFLVILMLVPSSGDGWLQNLPFLILLAVVVLGVLLFGIIKRAHLCGAIKRRLREKGFRISKSSALFVILGFWGQYGIVCEKDTVWRIVLLMRRRAYLTYHFETPKRLELYRTTRMAVKNGGQARVTVSNQTETRRVGVYALPFAAGDRSGESFLIMDRFPSRISDAEHREPLGNGDTAASCFRIYDKQGFLAFLESL